jgi:hypothetical protein
MGAITSKTEKVELTNGNITPLQHHIASRGVGSLSEKWQ